MKGSPLVLTELLLTAAQSGHSRSGGAVRAAARRPSALIEPQEVAIETGIVIVNVIETVIKTGTGSVTRGGSGTTHSGAPLLQSVTGTGTGTGQHPAAVTPRGTAAENAAGLAGRGLTGAGSAAGTVLVKPAGNVAAGSILLPGTLQGETAPRANHHPGTCRHGMQGRGPPAGTAAGSVAARVTATGMAVMMVRVVLLTRDMHGGAV